MKKIAIVDFDVHHGNGTQEIIECLMGPKAFTVKNDVSPFSIFEVTTKHYKPWLDFQDGKNVLFSSVHLFDNYELEESSENNSDLPVKSDFKSIFYPGTGGADENTSPYEANVYPGGILNVPIKPGDASAANWRKSFTEVFDRLVTFKPDFIFCSAGFDAHEYDQIHGSEDTGINEFDYEWLTENLQRIANQYCQGRLVSVLEGGYNIKLGPMSPLMQSISAHVRTLKNTHGGPLF